MTVAAFAPRETTWSLVVAGNVRALMARRGVSQQRVAAVLDLSQTAVSKRLRGVTPWDVNEMGTLADAFGVRVHEVAKVHARDLEGDELRIVGKRGRSRLVPCPPAVALALRGRCGYLFPGREDGHLSASYVGRRIKALMPPGWTAHTLRHAAGTAVYEASDGDLFATQEFLGHSKPETTRRYVRVDRSRVVRAARAAAASWPDAG